MRATGYDVAVKQLSIDEKKNRLAFVLSEVGVLADASEHANVVCFHSAYFAPKLKLFWIAMELVDGAPLDELAKVASFDERCACWCVRSVLDALCFVHHHHHFHRDVRAGNVLVTSDGVVKLADFGLAARVSKSRPRRSSIVGELHMMAPEVMRGDEYDARIDVWSLGMMVFELIDKLPLLQQSSLQSALTRIERGGIPQIKLKSAAGRDFVAQCVTIDVAQRPTAADLLKHAWFDECPAKSPLPAVMKDYRGNCTIV